MLGHLDSPGGSKVLEMAGVGRDGWVIWGPDSPKTQQNDVLSRRGRYVGRNDWFV